MAGDGRAGWRVDPRGVAVAWGGLALISPALLAPQPVPPLAGLLLTAVGLLVLGRTLGGGRAGAVAGLLLGIAVLAPSLAPWATIQSMTPFLQVPGTPAWVGVKMASRLGEILAANFWAVEGAAMFGPLACAAVAAIPRSRPPSGEGWRAGAEIPFYLLLSVSLLVPVLNAALGKLLGNLDELVGKSPSAGSAAVVGGIAAAMAIRIVWVWFLAVGVVSLVWGVRAFLERREGVSFATTVGAGSLLVGWTLLMTIYLGLAAALGTVDAIRALTSGGEIGLSSVERMGPIVAVTSPGAFVVCALAIAVDRGCRSGLRWLLTRLRAPPAP